jgi:hypothetical protein
VGASLCDVAHFELRLESSDEQKRRRGSYRNGSVCGQPSPHDANAIAIATDAVSMSCRSALLVPSSAESREALDV